MWNLTQMSMNLQRTVAWRSVSKYLRYKTAMATSASPLSLSTSPTATAAAPALTHHRWPSSRPTDLAWRRPGSICANAAPEQAIQRLRVSSALVMWWELLSCSNLPSANASPVKVNIIHKSTQSPKILALIHFKYSGFGI